jgi:anti-sigma regulatory factor (Ser/Thr protein kinase)
MIHEADPVSLRLNLDQSLLPLATSFAENAGLAFGLGRPEALKLTLAVEEVFSYLCEAADSADEGGIVTLEAVGRVYCVELRIGFNIREMDLRLLNFASQYSPDDESSLHQLGLLLASRSVDQFSLAELPDGGMELKLIKEKVYPSPVEQEPPACAVLDGFEIIVPEVGQVKEAARLLTTNYETSFYPGAYTRPAKLADMVQSGEVGASLAVDWHGNVGGAMFWRFYTKSSLRAYGPYVFCQPDPQPIAQALVEFAINRVAKSNAVGVVCRYPTMELPKEYFEYLGDLDYLDLNGAKRPWPLYYRQLREDPGGVVWSHPELNAFLRDYYGRLALARDIHLYQSDGESRPKHSVISTHLDRVQGHVTLRPMVDGRDARENLEHHLAILKAEGIPNIFCNVDLGAAWQSDWMRDLLQLGFSPRLVLPFGGKSDLVVLQHSGESE